MKVFHPKYTLIFYVINQHFHPNFMYPYFFTMYSKWEKWCQPSRWLEPLECLTFNSKVRIQRKNLQKNLELSFNIFYHDCTVFISALTSASIVASTLSSISASSSSWLGVPLKCCWICSKDLPLVYKRFYQKSS